MARCFCAERLVNVLVRSPPQISHLAETVGRRSVLLQALHLNDCVEYFFMFPAMSLIRWVLIIDSTTCFAETASIFSATSICFDILSANVVRVEYALRGLFIVIELAL